MSYGFVFTGKKKKKKDKKRCFEVIPKDRWQISLQTLSELINFFLFPLKS